MLSNELWTTGSGQGDQYVPNRAGELPVGSLVEEINNIMTAEGLYKRQSDADMDHFARRVAAEHSHTEEPHTADERDDDLMLGARSDSLCFEPPLSTPDIRVLSQDGAAAVCWHLQSHDCAGATEPVCIVARLLTAKREPERSLFACRHEPRWPIRLDAVRARPAAAAGARDCGARLPGCGRPPRRPSLGLAPKDGAHARDAAAVRRRSRGPRRLRRQGRTSWYAPFVRLCRHFEQRVHVRAPDCARSDQAAVARASETAQFPSAFVQASAVLV